MNFQEAIDFKSQFEQNQIHQDGMIFKILVTPANQEDFARYMEDYRSGGFTDQTAKEFSSNNQFKVYGLWTDGINVVHKDLQ